MLSVLHKIFLFGCLGMLVEVFFTGIYSLCKKNWRATSQTYLWMLLVYGLAGVTLEAIYDALRWPAWIMAFIYLPLIYAFEFSSGWLLRKLIGRCPWDYGPGKWTVMGLIRLDYAPFWFILALAFNPVVDVIKFVTQRVFGVL